MRRFFVVIFVAIFALGAGSVFGEDLCPTGMSCSERDQMLIAQGATLMLSSTSGLSSPNFGSYPLRERRGQIVALEVTPTRKLRREEIYRKNFDFSPENAYETRDGIFLANCRGVVELNSRYFVRGRVVEIVEGNDQRFAVEVFEQRLQHATKLSVIFTAVDVLIKDIGKLVVAKAVPVRKLSLSEVGYWLGENENWVVYETAERGIFLAFRLESDSIKNKFEGKKIEVKGKLRHEKRGAANYFFILAG